jgi:regulator of protease activity HflC (stomatin/prohibitin superfamily)
MIVVWAIVGAVLFILAVVAFFSSVYTVEQQTIALIERFGRFKGLAEPGLHFRMPFGIDRIASRESLRIRQLDLAVETKTRDDVFVVIKLAIQYHIPDRNKVFDAYYKWSTMPDKWTVGSSMLSGRRSPPMKLDEVFENKDAIADEVKKHLLERMEQ